MSVKEIVNWLKDLDRQLKKEGKSTSMNKLMKQLKQMRKIISN